MIEIYLNGEKIEVTEAPKFKDMPKSDFTHTFTVKCDERNSDFKFYLAEVMRRSEQLPEIRVDKVYDYLHDLMVHINAKTPYLDITKEMITQKLMLEKDKEELLNG